MSSTTGLAMDLSGALNMAIQCFKYVQLGRNFKKDFSECILVLDMSMLRLSRWGAAFGIGEGRQPDFSKFPPEELLVAEDILKSIQTIFNDAKKVSLRQKKSLPQTEVAVLDDTADLDQRLQRLHITCQEIVEGRQKNRNNSMLAQTKWGIYKKERFDAMIAGIKDKVDYLIEEFPPRKEAEQELCLVEVNRIKDSEDLKRLGSFIRDTDPALQKALADRIKERGMGHLVEEFKLSDSSQMRVGDTNNNGRESKSHVVRSFQNSGNSVLNIGNINS